MNNTYVSTNYSYFQTLGKVSISTNCSNYTGTHHCSELSVFDVNHHDSGLYTCSNDGKGERNDNAGALLEWHTNYDYNQQRFNHQMDMIRSPAVYIFVEGMHKVISHTHIMHLYSFCFIF